jgi:outer membrane murein-binding lipoprotein Lpp
MALRATLSALLTSTTLSGGKRVTAHGLITAVPLQAIKYVSENLLETAVPVAGPKRVTAHYLVSAVSIHAINDIEFELLESGEIFGLASLTIDQTTANLNNLIPEHNPYRPRIPEQLVRLGDDFYDFAEENQQILREQHNITQAGDSTFPYQLMLEAHDNKLYKLGSIGRFYHEQYGLMLARYVQFDQLKSVTVPQSPMGLRKSNNALDWVVTNDITLSDPSLVVGLAAVTTLPKDKQYGWLIIDGPNLIQLKNNSLTSEISEAFVWHDSGEVSNTGNGIILGRRVNKVTNSVSLLAGQMWVRLESFSQTMIEAFIDAKLASLQTELDELESLVGTLPTGAAFVTLQKLVFSIQAALNKEISLRQAVDLQIQNFIANLGAITQADLDGALSSTVQNLNNQLNTLQGSIDAVRTIALEALDKANQALALDIGALNDQVTLILAQIATLRNKILYGLAADRPTAADTVIEVGDNSTALYFATDTKVFSVLDIVTTPGTPAWVDFPIYTDEKAMDAIAAMIAAGSHTNITVTYNDTGNAISFAVTGIIGYTAEQAQDDIFNNVVSGDGISAVYDDAANHLTITAVGMPVHTAQTTSFTHVLAMANRWIPVNSAGAVTVTFPSDAVVAFPIGTTLIHDHLGAGTITFAAGAGATLNSRGSVFNSAGQYAVIQGKKIAANTWRLLGDLA